MDEGDIVNKYEEFWVEEPATTGFLKKVPLWGSGILAVGALLTASLSGLVTWGFLTGYYHLASQTDTNLTWAYAIAGIGLFLLLLAAASALRRYGRRASGIPLVSTLCLAAAAWLWFVQAPRLADAEIGKYCDRFVEFDTPLPEACGGDSKTATDGPSSVAHGSTVAPRSPGPVPTAASVSVASTTTTRCPSTVVTVSPLDSWSVLRQTPGLSGRPEDAQTMWRATATISNPTSFAVTIRSMVAVALTRGDGSKVLVRADPLTRDRPAGGSDISSADTPAVQPGETLPVRVDVRARTGWGVATDNVYAEVQYGGPSGCQLTITGARPYAERPGGLSPCNNTSNSTACSR